MHFSPVVIAAGREEMFIMQKENLEETRIEKLESENNDWEFVDIDKLEENLIKTNGLN